MHYLLIDLEFEGIKIICLRQINHWYTLFDRNNMIRKSISKIKNRKAARSLEIHIIRDLINLIIVEVVIPIVSS